MVSDNHNYHSACDVVVYTLYHVIAVIYETPALIVTVMKIYFDFITIFGHRLSWIFYGELVEQNVLYLYDTGFFLTQQNLMHARLILILIVGKCAVKMPKDIIGFPTRLGNLASS